MIICSDASDTSEYSFNCTYRFLNIDKNERKKWSSTLGTQEEFQNRSTGNFNRKENENHSQISNEERLTTRFGKWIDIISRFLTSLTHNLEDFKSKHRRQSAEDTEDWNTRSYTADSSFKRFTGLKDETSSLGHHSTTPETSINRVERKVDRLEDLVWKLYEELDNKIQDLFDEHTNKFKQQNDIITSIFHGFGAEINTMKDDLHSCRSEVCIQWNPPFNIIYEQWLIFV